MPSNHARMSVTGLELNRDCTSHGVYSRVVVLAARRRGQSERDKNEETLRAVHGVLGVKQANREERVCPTLCGTTVHTYVLCRASGHSQAPRNGLNVWEIKMSSGRGILQLK